MAATSSSESNVWQLSVGHGKQTLVVAFQPQHPQRVTLLKLEVEKLTGVAPKHQRLIYRGKELLADDGSGSSSSDLVKNKKKASPPPPLVNNAKLMLLLNQAYHQEAAKRTTSPAKPAAGTDEQTLLSSSNETTPTPAVAKKQAMAIDIDSLDGDEMLVQAFRGKANYELILKRDDVVMAVKECVSCMLGLAPQGIRLVVKGKTPKDDTRLSELLGAGARTIKCMVLLQAQQHVVLEKEDDLRQLLNELTQLQVETKRLEKQIARNFASREETSIRVSALVDGAQRVHSNLELLLDHLSPKGGGALTKPRANQQTTDLLTKAIQNSQTLCETCQALLQRLTLLLGAWATQAAGLTILQLVRPGGHVALLLGFTAAAVIADSIELDGLDVYPPFLPEYVAQQDTIADLEFRVYFPPETEPTKSLRVTPTCDSVIFSPSSFVFDANQSVYKFNMESLASGAFTIEYLAQEESIANSTASVLFSQTIQVLDPPKAFDVSDLEWRGVILQNDSFDQPAPANNSNASYSTPFWGKLKYGYPSGACGAFDGDRALYFTSLGDRFAVTAPLNLLGFHGKMHFYHVYGFKDVQSYDSTGDNRTSCELVDAEEETVFSYLPPGQNYLNRSAWQQIYEVPLQQLDQSSVKNNSFSTHSVSLPLWAMHTSAQFRWEQKSHSSFPLDVASGMTKAEILQVENDDTSVNGLLGLEEQEVWHYRNLFDQWALDNVRLEVRLNVPLFILQDSQQTPGSTDVVVMSPIQNSWVEFLVGDGTHAFPSCGAADTNTRTTQESIAHLTTSGYVHAVACLDVNSSLISSFLTRSPRLLVQARSPLISSSLDASVSIDEWSVTIECDGCDFMRYTLLLSSATADSGGFSARGSPSCSYGALVNGTSQLVPVSSNARLQSVACRNGLIASDLIESALYNVHPRPPTFAFEYLKTTVSGVVNVTIVPSDATSVGILYSVGTSDTPSCSTGKSVIQNAGNLTVEVKVSDVLRAVACCMDRECDDSEVAVWGPLTVNAIALVFSMVCSRVKPLTMIVDVRPVTVNAAIRYHIGLSPLSSLLTCASGGVDYTGPIEVSMTSTTVYAISCLDGLQASEPTVIPVNLGSCCSGLDAYRYPSCAHMLLFEDDFTNCIDTNKWDTITSQWGGDGVNGGVHASNVVCVKSDQLGKNVLSLAAHGDLYPGLSPVGTHRSAADGTLKERTVDDGFLEWALEGASTIPCDHQLERCPARRVGAAVSTKLELNAGILILRLKPCDASGTLTQVWWGKYEDKEEFAQQEVPFLPLWKAALYQAKTTSDVPFALSTTTGTAGTDLGADNGFVEISMQWDASEGRANLYVNGALVLKRTNNSTPSSSLLNSTLSLGVWFPNAIAGEPLFESCNVLVDSVQVFKMEIAGGRWCDFNENTDETQENAAVHSISCESDVDCQQWVTQNCFMGIYEALCVAHHDELVDFTNLEDEDNGDDEVFNGDAGTPSQSGSSSSSSSASSSASTEASKFCHFRLQPTAYSSVSSTEMTTRDQSLHLSEEE